jgi:hypothetical protein
MLAAIVLSVAIKPIMPSVILPNVILLIVTAPKINLHFQSKLNLMLLPH